MSNEPTVEPVSAAAAIVPLGQDPEMMSDFVLEAHEHLRSIESHVLRLEKDSADQEAIHAIFRAFHTMKGLAGFLDLGAIREVAHEVETVLDKARENQLEISARLIDVVLESADWLKRALQLLEAALQGQPPVDPGENGELLKRVRGLLAAPAEVVLENWPVRKEPQENQEVEAPAPASMPAASMPEEDPAEALRRLALSVAAKPAETKREAVPAAPPPPPALAPRQTGSRSVKVDTAKLDHLVDTVGEMVIAQSMIQHDPELASINRPRLVRNLAQLARITNEVQKTAMSMRMVPVGQLFQRMSRLVRDLTRKTGKQAELELIGEDTELDRNLVEELADPLMHMLRNSVDHGVEMPERRIQLGKPPVARLRLRASHESGNIVVEVSDDGNGLDRTKILARAVRNGLITDPENTSDNEIFNLIFHPGFSTAEQVTDVSGRGVGMDVVRRQVQKLRGRVEIHSTTGQGTMFLLKLPLTLAIVDGLIVGVGAERYIMPLFAVREMLRPTNETLFTVQDKGEMALVRERLLPVVRLYRRFTVRPKSEAATESLLIVTESSTRPFAILVDELLGKQEVVIKSLGPMLHDIPGIAGGAILGDGRVGLILDLDRIFEPERSLEHARAEA